jgi:hypothetical protein
MKAARSCSFFVLTDQTETHPMIHFFFLTAYEMISADERGSACGSRLSRAKYKRFIELEKMFPPHFRRAHGYYLFIL